jgi:hypothetical protein
VASVVVYREPQIVQQPLPANSALFAGQKITFTIKASAAIPVNYYWRFNGTNIPGATAVSYSLNNLQLTNTGSYSCFVSNAYGSVTSGVAALTVVASNYPYAQFVINDRPISYWRLDETSGIIAHDYISTNNGVYNNTLLNQTGNNLVDTHKAARFGPSINSYVGGIPLDFGTTNYTSNTNGQFSVECWVNGGAQTTDAGIITTGTGAGGEQFNLDCGGGSHAFRFFVRDNGGSAQLASGNVVPNSQWHHLVGVCNQSNGIVSLYVDGVLNATGTIGTNAGILDSTRPVTFGSRQSGSGNFDNQFVGSMEEVAIYRYSLNAAQVQAHYAAATNRAPIFAANPFSKPNANATQAYSSSISGSATDPNGDVVTYGKVGGPAWLSVAGNGFISGFPSNANANTNVFIVSARDASGLSNTASLYIYVNGVPGFVTDPFTSTTVTVGQSYSANIASQATDPNPTDVLNFSKVSGPSWLTVNNSGALSGTPLDSDVGTNSFVVSVADFVGLTGTATMTIAVAPQIAASLSLQGGNLLLNWSGGVGPYEVQMTTDLSSTNWTTIATSLATPTLLVTPTNEAAFYRIVGE